MNSLEDSFIIYLEKELNYSKETIINYDIDIKKYCAFLKKENKNIISVDKDTIRKYLKYLDKHKLSNKTISRKISALRTFYNYLVDIKKVEDNIFLQIKNPKIEKKLPNYLTSDEIDMILCSFADNDFYEVRNHLVIELIYSTGLRASELLNIKLKDIDLNNKEIKVMGKGSKERIVYYGDYVTDLLKSYLNKYRRSIKSEYLIISKNKEQLNISVLNKIIKEACKKVGIKRNISTHTLRHTFATDLLNNGSSINSVKTLLGHESLATTQIYTHITSEKIKEIYKNTHPRD